ncbi:structural maintenance of chromosome protein [Polychytrium aggregatum]|uniref:structural maintenance of chromosome protein n=1 Tax=Polychytrium aggregatum TaxID=110093 RepID=UPI0022FF2687|nr:structural maintenance of chromosome protein [Polychytrium aggregatum]KAI9202171.1 structural maintenance of chromosome protein [Polychytrium aggregatum]
MHIKQIAIQGFKSYRDQTLIEEFSPSHNVIVGRNGSGKSNFFWAIRFVLSDAYSNMTKEERQSLLHEGTSAVMAAHVEIIFDNADNRFPTGRDTVVLRRTIGAKKDEYHLDKKVVTKQDVMQLLESAGFSRSNPYYIVPQGRITNLTNAKDSERLNLLKEVAGTKVYEQRRQESLKIIQDTDQRRAKIDDLMQDIETRMAELETEREELKQYQELDRERRCLEYTVYSREQEEINHQIALNEKSRSIESMSASSRQHQYNEREKEIAEIERRVRGYQQQIDLLAMEKRQLSEAKDEQLKAKAQVDLIVKDLEDAVNSNQSESHHLLNELEQVEQQIAEKEQELEAIVPKYDSIVAEERHAKARLEGLELERSALVAKQGRKAQFRTQAERDRWISAELKTLNESKALQLSDKSRTAEERSKLQSEATAISADIRSLRKDMADGKQAMEVIEQRFQKLRSRRSEQDEARKELWRKDNLASASLEAGRDELSKYEQGLMSTMDRNTSAGIQALRRVVDKLRISGVYGPLYELFDVDEQFRTAVEVIAGNSLFHIVVDTDETATRVLEALNRERVGRLTFMPLNRLKTKPVEYPVSHHAIPMISKLRFDRLYEKAFLQVFGKAIITSTLEVGASFAKSHGLNAVTLDGDQADRKGALRGGYHDVRKSRLESIGLIKQLKRELEDEAKKSESIKQELARVDQEITLIRDELGQCDAERKEILDKREPLTARLSKLIRDEASLKETIRELELSEESIASGMRALESQIEAYQTELRTVLQQNLSDAESARLADLGIELDHARTELNGISAQKSELETPKALLEIALNSNLKRRREAIQTQLEAIDSGDGADEIQVRTAEIETLNKAINRIQKRSDEVESDFDQIVSKQREESQALEKLRLSQMEDYRGIEQQHRGVEKYMQRKALLMKRKDECDKNLREVGVLPEGRQKYEDMDTKKLVKALHKVKEELKKYSHVNKKAFEQYSNFTKQRDVLENRKHELDESSQSINNLIDVLDRRKDEAISRTFKQVAKYFGEVWEKLVPQGRGRLIMLRRADLSEEDIQDLEEEEESEGLSQRASQTRTSAIDQFVGVGIQVSFSSKTDEGLRMSQLSGGQKSLVALALIFAIQKCDPAPFYLFDEIDAALDAQYRTAVANMVHELSGKAQFITTTFRPELLVHADKYYGVTFTNKVSQIQILSKDEAQAFVQE